MDQLTQEMRATLLLEMIFEDLPLLYFTSSYILKIHPVTLRP